MEKLRDIGIKKLNQVTQQQGAESWLHSTFFRFQIPCWKEQHYLWLASEKSINCQSLTQVKKGRGDCRINSAMSAYAPCEVSIFKRICTMQLAHGLWNLKGSNRKGTKNTKTFLLQILAFVVKASACDCIFFFREQSFIIVSLSQLDWQINTYWRCSTPLYHMGMAAVAIQHTKETCYRFLNSKNLSTITVGDP